MKAIQNPEKYRDPQELKQLERHQVKMDRLRLNNMKVQQQVSEHLLWVRSPTSGQLKSVDELLGEVSGLYSALTQKALRDPDAHRSPEELKFLKQHASKVETRRKIKVEV